MTKIFIVALLSLWTLGYSSDYFPISIGNAWIYNFLDSNGGVVGTDSICIRKDTVISNSNIFIQIEYFVYNQIPDTIQSNLISNGNDISLLYRPDSLTYQTKFFQHVYANGDFWYSQFYDDTLIAEYYGHVSVPAGEFDSCYLVHYKRRNSASWVFAPNVGLVKMVNNGKDDFVLQRFSLNSLSSINNIRKKPSNLNSILNVVNQSQQQIKLNINKPNSEFIGLSIFSITGVQIYKINNVNSNQYVLDCSVFPPGLYVLNIYVGKDKHSKLISIKK